MKTYVLDANAVVRLVSNGAGREKIVDLLRKAVKNEAKILISVINRAEALYVLACTVDLEQAKGDLRKLGEIVEPIPVDLELAEAAAGLILRYKLGLGDSIAAALALDRDATLVTADPEFAKLGKQLKTMALPRHGK
jgi:ribonuclease VapC